MSDKKTLLEVIRNLSEAELCSQVITPLLEKMFPGARVEFTHGTNERGRDYICYARHPILDQSMTYCIQVKNHKMNSQIGSPYSISTVRNQVQAAKETGIIGVNNEIIRPDNVWVMNTYDCTDSFRRTNKSDFSAIAWYSGRFIDGMELEVLLNRLCPQVVAELLQWQSVRSLDMISGLSVHRESRAFGLRFDRLISSFYVNARTSVGSTLMALFEADKLRIRSINFIHVEPIEDEEIINFNPQSGSKFSADDIARSPTVADWSALANTWPLQIQWSSRIAADPKQRGRSIIVKEFEVDTTKTQVVLRKKLIQARKNFPATLKKNELKVRSVLETFLSAEKFLRTCETSKSIIRLSKDLAGAKSPILQIDSELSILKLGRIVLIEGGPGGGKTTLLRRIAIAALKAGSRLKFLECAKVESAQILAAEAEMQRRSRDFRQAATRVPIWDAVFNEIDRSAGSTDELPSKDGGLVGIIDGLDELPAGLLNPFVEAFLSEANHFDQLIVSCRDSYFSDLKGRVPVLTVSKFERAERDDFFGKWFRDKPEKQEVVLALFNRSRDLAENARVPLMATLIAALIENDLEPGSRLEIYRARVRLLLDFWDRSREVQRARISPEHKRRYIQELAYKMHLRHSREISKVDAEVVFSESLGYAGYKVDFDLMISELVRIAGILQSEDDGALSFGHLSFQEHLAGERLARTAHPRDIRSLLGDSWWNEPIAFYAAAKTDISDLLEHCSKVGCLEAYCAQLLALIQYASYTNSGAVDVLRDLVLSANRVTETEED